MNLNLAACYSECSSIVANKTHPYLQNGTRKNSKQAWFLPERIPRETGTQQPTFALVQGVPKRFYLFQQLDGILFLDTLYFSAVASHQPLI